MKALVNHPLVATLGVTKLAVEKYPRGRGLEDFDADPGRFRPSGVTAHLLRVAPCKSRLVRSGTDSWAGWIGLQKHWDTIPPPHVGPLVGIRRFSTGC